MTVAAPPHAPLDRFTFDRLLTTLLFLAIAIAACLMPAQNDTWWQLRAGHDMWSGRTVLLRDTFSHTAYGTCGIKGWIFKGEILEHDPMAQDKKLAEGDHGGGERRQRRDREPREAA